MSGSKPPPREEESSAASSEPQRRSSIPMPAGFQRRSSERRTEIGWKFDDPRPGTRRSLQASRRSGRSVLKKTAGSDPEHSSPRASPERSDSDPSAASAASSGSSLAASPAVASGSTPTSGAAAGSTLAGPASKRSPTAANPPAAPGAILRAVTTPPRATVSSGSGAASRGPRKPAAEAAAPPSKSAPQASAAPQEPSGAVEAAAVHAEAVHAEAVHAEAVHAEAVHAEAVHAEAVHAEAVHAEALHTDAVHAEGVKANAVHAEGVKAEAVHAEAGRVAGQSAEWERVEARDAEPPPRAAPQGAPLQANEPLELPPGDEPVERSEPLELQHIDEQAEPVQASEQAEPAQAGKRAEPLPANERTEPFRARLAEPAAGADPSVVAASAEASARAAGNRAEVLGERREQADVVYLERLLWLPSARPLERVIACLRAELELIRADLDAPGSDPTPTFVQLALFDHRFTGQPERPPVGTLSWYSWRQGSLDLRVYGQPVNPAEIARSQAALRESLSGVGESPPGGPVRAEPMGTAEPMDTAEPHRSAGPPRPEAPEGGPDPLEATEKLPTRSAAAAGGVARSGGEQPAERNGEGDPDGATAGSLSPRPAPAASDSGPPSSGEPLPLMRKKEPSSPHGGAEFIGPASEAQAAWPAGAREPGSEVATGAGQLERGDAGQPPAETAESREPAASSLEAAEGSAAPRHGAESAPSEEAEPPLAPGADEPRAEPASAEPPSAAAAEPPPNAAAKAAAAEAGDEPPEGSRQPESSVQPKTAHSRADGEEPREAHQGGASEDEPLGDADEGAPEGSEASPAESAAPRGNAEPTEAVDPVDRLFERMHELLYCSELSSGAQYILATLNRHLPSSGVLIHLFDMERREFVLVRARGPKSQTLLLTRTNAIESYLDEALRRQETLKLGQSAAHTPHGLWRRLGVQLSHGLCSPVLENRRYLGAIELGREGHEPPFSGRDVLALEYVCFQFAGFLAARSLLLDRESLMPRS